MIDINRAGTVDRVKIGHFRRNRGVGLVVATVDGRAEGAR